VKDTFKLAFVDEKLELKWFRLDSEGIVGDADIADDTALSAKILVLPTTCGLPFQIELSFGDSAKIARVVPQFVADQYAEVNDGWLFSWSVAKKVSANEAPEHEAEPVFLVSGIAFPPEFSPERIAPDIIWRLAVPDIFLPRVEEKSALKVVTPVNSYLAIMTGKDQPCRILADESVPVRPFLSRSGLSELKEVEILQSADALLDRIQALQNEPDHLDLSGWQKKRVQSSLRWSVAGLALLFVGLVFISHFFLWFESVLAEGAAARTAKYMSESFNKVFPEVPVVDAVSQIKRKISEATKSLEEAGSIPNVPWLDVMNLTSVAANHSIELIRVVGKTEGFRFQGAAPDYSSLEKFRRQLESASVVEKVSARESRKSGDKVLFVLEGAWKS
jgi:hypothetical protein